MSTKEIFQEIITEAVNGKVIIDDEEWNIKFNTKIGNEQKIYSNNNELELNIRNIDYFIEKLNKYLKIEQELNRKSISYFKNEDSYKKLLITSLFSNFTTSDFDNPNIFLDRYIDFLNDNTLSKISNLIIPIGGELEGNSIKLCNIKQSIFMETPNKLEISIINNNDSNLEYKLPEISYGISGSNCYIYSILNKDSKNNSEANNEYKKKISRLLYKLNSNVYENESEEFKKYREKLESYYPENISDVSVSSVLSLLIFTGIIKEKVDYIKGVPYLPLRYESRYMAADETSNPDKKNERFERNDMIQSNATEKFIRTFNRVVAHSDNLEVVSYPYEVDEFITCSTKPNKKEINNNFVSSVSDGINSKSM